MQPSGPNPYGPNPYGPGPSGPPPPGYQPDDSTLISNGPGQGPGQAGTGQGPGRKQGRPRRGRIRRFFRLRTVRVILALIAVFCCWAAFSVGQALTAPGGGSTSAKLAEWARDHYLGPVVTFGEWISYNPPKTGGKPGFSLAAPGGTTPARDYKKTHGFVPNIPQRLTSPAGQPLPGEGAWRVLETVKGYPAIFGTFLRPSAVYTSYVAGLVSMDQRLVRFSLRPGAEDPGPGHWKAATWVPPGTRKGLLATFNGGFKLDSARRRLLPQRRAQGRPGERGGVGGLLPQRHHQDRFLGPRAADDPQRGRRQAEPQAAGRPREGPGHGEPERDHQLGRHPRRRLLRVAFRARHHPDGRIIFAYGPSLDVKELASLLRRAGAVEALQLDINPEWMSYDYYKAASAPAEPHPARPAADPAGQRLPLLPGLQPRLHGGLLTVTADTSATEVVLSAPARGARWVVAVLRTARPRQWPKNLLVFAAPLAGASLGRRDGLLYALVAAAAFGFASVAVYFVNDVADAERDRLHPRKRHRPVASGELPKRDAVVLGAGCALAGLAAGLLIAEPLLTATVAAYLALSFLYSWKLKHVPVLELLFVASGFLLRVLGGAAATHVPPSGWFLMVCSLGALGVALAKRYTELTNLGAEAIKHRPVMRWYRPAALRLSQLAVGAGMIAAYLAWAASEHPEARSWHLASALPLVAALVRFAFLTGRRTTAPVEDLLTRDVPMLVCEACWLGLFVAGL